MVKELIQMDGFRTLAVLISEAARVDPDPKVGRLLPKGY